MIETLDLDDEALDYKPNINESEKENRQILHVGMKADFFKRLQSVTADLTLAEQISLIKKSGVLGLGRSNAMTPEERKASIVVTVGQGSVDNNWD